MKLTFPPKKIQFKLGLSGILFFILFLLLGMSPYFQHSLLVKVALLPSFGLAEFIMFRYQGFIDFNMTSLSLMSNRPFATLLLFCQIFSFFTFIYVFLFWFFGSILWMIHKYFKTKKI